MRFLFARSTDGVEVYAFLVGATVFKTGETGSLGLAGSIPVHLRHRPASALTARTARAEGLGDAGNPNLLGISFNLNGYCGDRLGKFGIRYVGLTTISGNAHEL